MMQIAEKNKKRIEKVETNILYIYILIDLFLNNWYFFYSNRLIEFAVFFLLLLVLLCLRSWLNNLWH